MSLSPGQIVKLRLLSEVPMSEYADLAPPKNPLDEKERLSFFKRLRKQKPEIQSIAKKSAVKTIELNAAAWLSFGNDVERPVSLWLTIRDDKGERSLLVDEQNLNGSRSTMLSGSVKIKVYGGLTCVNACCGGLAPDNLFRVDELYVKRNYDVSPLESIQQTSLFKAS